MLYFGYKTRWIAVRGHSEEAVADALRLNDRLLLECEDGVNRAHFKGVFVAPPVRGWTLAHGRVGLGPDFTGGWLPLVRWLEDLSNTLGEVQFFGSERGWCSFQWVQARDGIVHRAYGVSDGNPLLNIGSLTDVEIEIDKGFLGLDSHLADGHDFPETLENVPTEEDVLKIAGKWSVNPTLVDDSELLNAMGIFGVAVSQDSQ